MHMARCHIRKYVEQNLCDFDVYTYESVDLCETARIVIIHTVYPLFTMYPFWVITKIIKRAIHLGLQFVRLVFYLYGQIK